MSSPSHDGAPASADEPDKPGPLDAILASVGLRLGVLSVATYTTVILVAVMTSLMAPPILRLAMRRVELTAEEDLRNQDRVGV